MWSPLPGPTRAVNLLTCTNLDVFKAQITDTFIPKPIFPGFGLSPPPSYELALDVLSNALRLLASRSRPSSPEKVFILYIENINRLASFDGWQDCFVPLAFAVASRGNGIVVGNSSAFWRTSSSNHCRTLVCVRPGSFIHPFLRTLRSLRSSWSVGGTSTSLVVPPALSNHPSAASLISGTETWRCLCMARQTTRRTCEFRSGCVLLL